MVLSLGIELSTEEFFDPHYLTRNLASLFGIPASRMRVPKIVAGSDRRRRLNSDTATAVDIEVLAASLCDGMETCGPHGACGAGGECICEEGWQTPQSCTEGDCLCSKQAGCPSGCDSCHADGTCVSCIEESPVLLDGACVVSCPANFAVLPSATGSAPTCAPCHETCGGSCLGPAADQCTACDSFGLNSFLLGGQCMLACPDGHYADEQRVCQAHAPLATQIPLATHISHLPRTSHCHAHLALVTHVPLPRTFRTVTHLPLHAYLTRAHIPLDRIPLAEMLLAMQDVLRPALDAVH